MSIKHVEVDEFRNRNRITPDCWTAASIPWSTLRAIGLDYEERQPILARLATQYSSTLQLCPSVHSVRWRIKDTEHLLEKIVRKRADRNSKYLSIDATTYHSVITDLIGMRALHLFKHDWAAVDRFIRDEWTVSEGPIAHIREGDSSETRRLYEGAGCAINVHGAGYRSVHYVLSFQHQRKDVFAELQARTLFEEGWSEIDHHVRYPNFDSDPTLALFLQIFNRIAGSADEMAGFVHSLRTALNSTEEVRRASESKIQQEVGKVESLVKELANEKQKTAAYAAKLASIQKSLLSIQNSAAPSTPTLPRTAKAVPPPREAYRFSIADAAEVQRLTESQMARLRELIKGKSAKKPGDKGGSREGA